MHPKSLKNFQKPTRLVLGNFLFFKIFMRLQVLGDSKRRNEYDQLGTAPGGYGAGAGPMGGAGANGPWPDFGWQFRSARSPEQIFREMFKDFQDPFKRTFAESTDGFEASQEVKVKITFEEAARGVRKDLQLNVIDSCGICTGTGVSPGYKKVFMV